jgi:hypothetical protein
VAVSCNHGYESSGSKKRRGMYWPPVILLAYREEQRCMALVSNTIV